MGICMSLQAKEPSPPPDGNIEASPPDGIETRRDAQPESSFPPGATASGPLQETPALQLRLRVVCVFSHMFLAFHEMRCSIM